MVDGQIDKLDVPLLVRVNLYELLISNILTALIWTVSAFKLLDNRLSLLGNLAYTYMSHIKGNTI